MTTYPISCLFCRVVKYDEREKVESTSSLTEKITIACSMNNSKTFFHPIATLPYQKLEILLAIDFEMTIVLGINLLGLLISIEGQ